MAFDQPPMSPDPRGQRLNETMLKLLHVRLGTLTMAVIELEAQVQLLAAEKAELEATTRAKPPAST